ncbi:hypothetical protein P4H08_27995 [Bacillus cereus]|nr:hypothetical protein [Bacillus cereus]
MKINDIIENLKELDQKSFSHNRVHNGWALLFDTLYEHWTMWKGPFFDGAHREKYVEFLSVLDKITENLGTAADAYDYKTFSYEEIRMWDDPITITFQPKINNSIVASMDDLIKGIDETTLLWNELKNMVNERYEHERSKRSGL